MEVLARRAVEADTPFLQALGQRAATELAGLRGGPLLLKERAAEAGDSSGVGRGAFVALAEIEGVPVGYLEAKLLLLDEEAPYCRVTALYVEPDAREVGAGEALLAQLLRWAKEAGARGIDVDVLPGAREAKSFLEAAGFTTRRLSMYRPLHPSR